MHSGESRETLFREAFESCGTAYTSLTHNRTIEGLSQGRDDLGDAYCKLHSPNARRKFGATFTPIWLVEEMLEKAKRLIEPDCIIDCGAGSGRFAIAAARAFPNAHVVAIEKSPERCKVCAANVHLADLEGSIEIVRQDFLEYTPDPRRGKTLWIGNPPYVRHHDIDSGSKEWFARTSESLGERASILSGLHVYFVAKIASEFRKGDAGVLVTSAEWLDVNYGTFLKRLLLDRLGLSNLQLFEPTRPVFEDAMTTACVFSFGSDDDNIDFVSATGNVETYTRQRLEKSRKWSHLSRPATQKRDEGLVPLGEICSVHRGAVTGNNRFWVRRKDDISHIPSSLIVPIVAHAKDLTGECIAQNSPDSLSRLIVLPEKISDLAQEEAEVAAKLIDEGVRQGVDKGYVASHRKTWWAVKPPDPPAIMMTYMSRSAPTFVRNDHGLSMLNVVHGLYPKTHLSHRAISALVDYLNAHVGSECGRTYCGGLLKFEPREVEAIPVPSVEILEEMGS